jgi:cytochrome c-type biogenesis protein CcmH
MSRYFLFVVWAFFVALPAHAQPAGTDGSSSSVTEDPLERRMLEIAKDLRCTVCQNQPVAESNADLAKDMRALIREQLEAGKSREEIMTYFVDRYGDYVLLKPPYDSAGMILWVLPPIVLFLLAISAWLFIRRHAHQAIPPAPVLSPEDAARIRAARKQD